MTNHLTAEVLRDIANRVEKLPTIPTHREAYRIIEDLFEVMVFLKEMTED